MRAGAINRGVDLVKPSLQNEPHE